MTENNLSSRDHFPIGKVIGIKESQESDFLPPESQLLSHLKRDITTVGCTAKIVRTTRLNGADFVDIHRCNDLGIVHGLAPVKPAALQRPEPLVLRKFRSEIAKVQHVAAAPENPKNRP